MQNFVNFVFEASAKKHIAAFLNHIASSWKVVSRLQSTVLIITSSTNLIDLIVFSVILYVNKLTTEDTIIFKEKIHLY